MSRGPAEAQISDLSWGGEWPPGVMGMGGGEETGEWGRKGGGGGRLYCCGISHWASANDVAAAGVSDSHQKQGTSEGRGKRIYQK